MRNKGQTKTNTNQKQHLEQETLNNPIIFLKLEQTL